MNKIRFSGILQKDGWCENATVTIDEKGVIAAIETNDQNANVVNGFAIPGFQNAHSHAFQYAMAGLAEKHSNSQSNDDFWGWRETMYQIALTMTPDDLEAVATMLYAEMVRHGYTHVAEFHYLHHDVNGKPYENLAEHGSRLIAAAKQVGIKITLVPMFYQCGGFGKQPQERQRRFISKTIDDYYNLLEASQSEMQYYDGASIGYGIHSLRAVVGPDIISVLNNKELVGPFHIHISEQLKEVEDSIRYQGKRPVEWLLDNVDVNKNFHLVHATHLIESEIKGIAESGAHVVLCPSTEGNLGDGIFPLRKYQDLGGKWSIGTDSHVGLNPCEELRILDYGQRLTTHKRNTFIDEVYSQSGDYGYNQALLAGRAAMGNNNQEYFKVGETFDAVIFDANVPLLATTSASNRLSSIIYSSDSTWVIGTMVNGRCVVKNQMHEEQRAIYEAFSKALRKLHIR